MADEGATIYYSSKQKFSFERIYNYLNNLGLSIRNPDTNLITGIKEGDFSKTSFEEVQKMINQKQSLGLYLWLKTRDNIFWSLVIQNNFFMQNFTFNYLSYDDIEQRISRVFIKFALQELKNVNDNFLGFTLDQFGHTDHYDFSQIFQPENNEMLSQHYISDITFLPRNKIKRLALGSESEIIRVNDRSERLVSEETAYIILKEFLDTGKTEFDTDFSAVYEQEIAKRNY